MMSRRRFWAAIRGGHGERGCSVEARRSQACRNKMVPEGRAACHQRVCESFARAVSGRYLSLAEREEIALLRCKLVSMQEIARASAGRPQSTI